MNTVASTSAMPVTIAPAQGAGTAPNTAAAFTVVTGQVPVNFAALDQVEPELRFNQKKPRELLWYPHSGPQLNPLILQGLMLLNPVSWWLFSYLPRIAQAGHLSANSLEFAFLAACFIVAEVWIWKRTLHQRWLCRHGKVSLGTVTAMTRTTGDPYGTIKYQFEIADGTSWQNSIKVSIFDYDKFRPSQRMTVLYDEKKPERNTLYKWSTFKAKAPPVSAMQQQTAPIPGTALSAPSTAVTNGSLNQPFPRNYEPRHMASYVSPEQMQIGLILANPVNWFNAVLAYRFLEEPMTSGHFDVENCTSLVFCTLINLVLWLIAWNLVWKKHLRDRFLVSKGLHVQGTIRKKFQTTSNTPEGPSIDGHYIEVTYRTLAGQFMLTKLKVSRAEFALLSEGSTKTILYSPTDPTDSILYDLCSYRAI